MPYLAHRKRNLRAHDHALPSTVAELQQGVIYAVPMDYTAFPDVDAVALTSDRQIDRAARLRVARLEGGWVTWWSPVLMTLPCHIGVTRFRELSCIQSSANRDYSLITIPSPLGL